MSNYKNGEIRLSLTQNSLSTLVLFFSELKLLKIKDIFSLTKLLFMFDVVNENVPQEL